MVDDPELAGFVRRGLEEQGDVCTHVDNARDGLLRAADDRFDVTVFDRLLPGMDGRDAVRLLREASVWTPILLLTALSGIDDRVPGLEAGADDYMVKPFAFSELYARLRALCRRQPLADAPSVLRIGPLEADLVKQRVTRSGREIALSPQEFKILVELMRNEGQFLFQTERDEGGVPPVRRSAGAL